MHGPPPHFASADRPLSPGKLCVLVFSGFFEFRSRLAELCSLIRLPLTYSHPVSAILLRQLTRRSSAASSSLKFYALNPASDLPNGVSGLCAIVAGRFTPHGGDAVRLYVEATALSSRNARGPAQEPARPLDARYRARVGACRSRTFVRLSEGHLFSLAEDVPRPTLGVNLRTLLPLVLMVVTMSGDVTRRACSLCRIFVTGYISF